MNETEISWTDATWNPMSGCDVIAPECKFCYARSLAEQKRGTAAFPKGFDLTFRPHKLREPFALKKPSLIFTNSMSDFGHIDVPDEYRDRILDVIVKTPQHHYQVLTKRPENVLRWSVGRTLPPNLWLGVSAGHVSSHRLLDVLREIPATVRFVSCEPMLSDMRFDLRGIHWMIGGGESGVHLMDADTREQRGMAVRDKYGKWTPREDRVPWARHLRDDCAKAGVAFFWKQWGGVRPHSAGRILDGRTHDDFPVLPQGRAAGVHVHRQAALSLPVITSET